MKKFLLSVALAASVSVSQAFVFLPGNPVLVSYDFGSSSFDPSAWVNPTIDGLDSASDFTGGLGMGVNAGFSDYSALGFGNSTFSFEVTLAPTYELLLSGFSFNSIRAADGPSNWSLSISSYGLVGPVPMISGTWTTQGFSTSPINLGGGTIVFTLQGGGAMSDGGSWLLDNVQLSGAVIPEASTYALVAGLLGLIVVLVRRRR